ncbi:hypothetical protein JCM6882_004161 [Rhodosporidiobolus microsporus]
MQPPPGPPGPPGAARRNVIAWLDSIGFNALHADITVEPGQFRIVNEAILVHGYIKRTPQNPGQVKLSIPGYRIAVVPLVESIHGAEPCYTGWVFPPRGGQRQEDEVYFAEAPQLFPQELLSPDGRHLRYKERAAFRIPAAVAPGIEIEMRPLHPEAQHGIRYMHHRRPASATSSATTETLIATVTFFNPFLPAAASSAASDPRIHRVLNWNNSTREGFDPGPDGEEMHDGLQGVGHPVEGAVQLRYDPPFGVDGVGRGGMVEPPVGRRRLSEEGQERQGKERREVPKGWAP